MTTDAHHRTSQHDASTSTVAELEDSNSVKDEFLGLVSHELRTPVTTILGNARLLQDRRDQLAAEQRDSMLADIAAEAERLHEIIENLLSLTRLGTGTRPELEPTALDRVIQRSVEHVRRRYPDRPIAFSSRPSVIVDADRTYLELLIENLVGNAAKYSPDGSPIDVLVEEADERSASSSSTVGSALTQPGADLFEPFYRGERARSTAGGVGIGLAVCRRIVHLLGGRIWARSRDEGGAEFGFALPIARTSTTCRCGPCDRYVLSRSRSARRSTSRSASGRTMWHPARAMNATLIVTSAANAIVETTVSSATTTVSANIRNGAASTT